MEGSAEGEEIESSSTNVILNLKQLLYPNLYPNYFGAFIRSCPGELN